MAPEQVESMIEALYAIADALTLQALPDAPHGTVNEQAARLAAHDRLVRRSIRLNTIDEGGAR